MRGVVALADRDIEKLASELERAWPMEPFGILARGIREAIPPDQDEDSEELEIAKEDLSDAKVDLATAEEKIKDLESERDGAYDDLATAQCSRDTALASNKKAARNLRALLARLNLRTAPVDLPSELQTIASITEDLDGNSEHVSEASMKVVAEPATVVQPPVEVPAPMHAPDFQALSQVLVPLRLLLSQDGAISKKSFRVAFTEAERAFDAFKRGQQ